MTRPDVTAMTGDAVDRDTLGNAAVCFVSEALPKAVCLKGAVSGLYRIYRDDSDKSSYIGTGKTMLGAWLKAAAYLADKQ